MQIKGNKPNFSSENNGYLCRYEWNPKQIQYFSINIDIKDQPKQIADTFFKNNFSQPHKWHIRKTAQANPQSKFCKRAFFLLTPY
jgi:hypothetical protein